jgi:hypothetical protein
MADKIKVTDPPVAGRGPFQNQENASSTTVDGMSYITTVVVPSQPERRQMLTPGSTGPLSNKKLVAKLRSPTSPSSQPTTDLQNGYVGDGTRLSETHIDPLSQVCTERVRDAGTGANCASPYSKSSRERIRRLQYRNYDRKTPSPCRFNHRLHPTMRTRTRSSVGRRHAMQAGVRQTRSRCLYSLYPQSLWDVMWLPARD